MCQLHHTLYVHMFMCLKTKIMLLSNTIFNFEKLSNAEKLTSTYCTPISLRLSGMLCDESKLITSPHSISTKQIQTHSSISTQKKFQIDNHHFNIYLKYWRCDSLQKILLSKVKYLFDKQELYKCSKPKDLYKCVHKLNYKYKEKYS